MLRSGVSLFLSALPAWPAICFRGISLSQALSIIGFSSNSVIVQKITASFLTNEMEYQLQLGCKHFPALQAISLFFFSLRQWMMPQQMMTEMIHCFQCRLFLNTPYKSHSFVCTSKCTDDNPHLLSFRYNDLLWKIWGRGRDVLDLQQDLLIKW